MKINEFVDSYNKANDERKMGVVENIIVKNKYVPFSEKMAICNGIIESTMFNPSDKSKFFINSNMRHFLLMLNLVKLYTDLEIDFTDENLNEQYDLLNKDGKLALIYSNIDNKETLEFNMILENSINDFMENNRDIIAFLENFEKKIDVVAKEFLKELR